jgi:hypothetical protein
VGEPLKRSVRWLPLIKLGSAMNHKDLPERWVGKLKAHLRRELGVNRDTLSAEDFHHSLKINFEDGSYAFFGSAFYLLDRELNEAAVFTEHCGYHIFPLLGTNLELFESKWTDVGPKK